MLRARQTAQVAGAAALVIGALHFGVGLASYDAFSFEALWFHGSGLAILLLGAMTLLTTSDRAWNTLVGVACVANLCGVALAVAFGSLTGWDAPQGPVLTVVFAVGAASLRLTHRRM
jgi:hypothetical protein